MSKETKNLKLYLPEDNEFYDVEKDQNENFEKLDKWSKNVNDSLGDLENKKSDKTHLHDDRYYTETEVDNMFKKYCPHGIGDYLHTENESHPATRWLGTTWIRVVDKALIGAGNKYELGSEGGATQVQLTNGNLPSHGHNYSSDFNWTHNHSYSNSVNWAHTHSWSGSINWAHTHYYSNSINWSHQHSQPEHAHTQPGHQHVVPWGEAGVEFPYGTIWHRNMGSKGNMDWDNNWMLTSPAGGEWTGAAAPMTNWSGGVTGFSGNTGSSGGNTNLGGNTSAAGTTTEFSGNTANGGTISKITGTTAATGGTQAFDILNPYRAVYIWKRIA